MKRLVGAALLTILLTAVVPLQNSPVTVANLTALRALPTTAAYNGQITRVTDGVAGAPAMNFTAGTSACATDDGASCVNSSDSKSWVGQFPHSGADVRQWGAVSGGTTDAHAALAAAFASGVQVPLIIPDATFRSSAQLTLPDGAILQGALYQPGSAVAGSGIQCDATVAGACLVLGNADNKPNIVSNLMISHGAGTLAGTAECLDIPGGLQTHVIRVECFNSVNGFESDDTAGNGIANYFSYIQTCKISGSHVIINSAPEEYFDHPQLGCDGAVDVTGSNYVLVTGNWDVTGGTLHFVDPHFNLGQNTVSCVFNFANFTGTTNQFQDFSLTGGHVEQSQNFFCSDSTVKSIAQVVVQGNDSAGNNGSNHFFAFNAATEPEYWVFQGNTGTLWGDFTLTPTAGPAVMNIHNNTFSGPVTITSASGGTAVITNNNYIGNVTINGAGWVTGEFSGTFLAGLPTFSNSALQNLNVTLNAVGCTPALQIGGSSTGITYSAGTPACSATLTNHYLTMTYELSVTSIGGLTGAATMTGLPYASSTFGNGPYGVAYATMASISGGIQAEALVSSHTVNFVQPVAAGQSQILNSNFGSCSSGTPCILQGTITYQVGGV